MSGDVAALASDDEAGSDVVALASDDEAALPKAEAVLSRRAAPDIALSRRAANLKRAREFKAAFARRAKRDLDKQLQQTGVPAPKLSFYVHSAPRGTLDRLTPSELNELLWQRWTACSWRHIQRSHNLHHRELTLVEETTMWRYTQHRQHALQRALMATQPFLLDVLSYRIKFDETQQILAVCPPEPGVSGKHRRTVSTTNIMALTAWVLTSEMGMPQPWTCPLVQLSRTTGDCLWEALKRALPLIGPFVGDAGPAAHWKVYVFCCDDASSNRKLCAHFENEALALHRQTIVITQRCLLHSTHHAARPIMNSSGINSLYRLALVFGAASYFRAVVDALRHHVRKSLAIVHTMEPAAQRVSRQVLEITLCSPAGAEIPQRQRDFIEEILSAFPGAWNSRHLVYRCTGGVSCDGGATCRRDAIQNATRLLLKLVLGSKVPVPALSRWMRFGPTAKRVAIGLAMHGIFAVCAPAKHNKPHPDVGAVGAANEADSDWHALHGERVQRTCEYLNASNTLSELLVAIICLRPGERIAAWIMSRDSRLQDADLKRRAENFQQLYECPLKHSDGSVMPLP